MRKVALFLLFFFGCYIGVTQEVSVTPSVKLSLVNSDNLSSRNLLAGVSVDYSYLLNDHVGAHLTAGYWYSVDNKLSDLVINTATISSFSPNTSFSFDFGFGIVLNQSANRFRFQESLDVVLGLYDMKIKNAHLPGYSDRKIDVWFTSGGVKLALDGFYHFTDNFFIGLKLSVIPYISSIASIVEFSQQEKEAAQKKDIDLTTLYNSTAYRKFRIDMIGGIVIGWKF